jgi:sulfhydrogenase subunit beta (sulfur reductase)
MRSEKLQIGSQLVLESDHLQLLLDALKKREYRIIGPTVRDGAVIYDELGSTKDLPAGWTDEQQAGTYRLARRNDDAFFGYTIGPHAWKRFLHPPLIRLWRAKRTGGGYQVNSENEKTPPFAFIGVRACELHAIAIQDRVFIEGQYVDPVYSSLRKEAFIIAVNCGQAGGTCFCVSMKTGPKATSGFDLCLTEILERDRHYFVAEVGSLRGAELLDEVPHRVATVGELETAGQVSIRAAEQMGRELATADIKELLYRNSDNPRWDNVAERCLTCGNCTMVCPTCFCTTVDDLTDLTGEHAERWRRWDSCFTLDFSYIHGGSVRISTKARYRQWMTHKLASWIDQFGTSGCVGCGRCITWCPVGIDITEEARAIGDSEMAKERKKEGNHDNPHARADSGQTSVL